MCSFLSEEQAWQRLVEAQKGVLQRDADARKEAPPPHPQAVESAGVDEAMEETRRKLAFQVRSGGGSSPWTRFTRISVFVSRSRLHDW